MAASRDAEVKALMECSLCLTRFRKPKCLPCIHTFCLDCLQKYVDRNHCAGKLSCPLCREEFPIPSEGLSRLRDNFFVKSMIDMAMGAGMELQDISEGVRDQEEDHKIYVKCGMCTERSDELGHAMAQKYCQGCELFFCKTCVSVHDKLKLVGEHDCISLNEKNELIEGWILNRSRFCDKHYLDPLRLYCHRCQVPICMMCHAVEHIGHQCEEIKDTAGEFRGQIDNKIAELKRVLSEIKTVSQNLKFQEQNARQNSKQNMEDIRETFNDLKRALNLYEQEFMDEIKLHEAEIVKGITSTASEVEFQGTLVENLIIYLENISKTGSHCDVAYSGKELVLGAEHLLEKCKAELLKESPAISHAKFIRGSAKILKKELIGQLVTGVKTLLILGLDIGPSVMQKICQISLDRPDTIHVIDSTPAEIGMESAACVVDNVLYAVGIGKARNELWKWSAGRDEWSRCSDLPLGRRKHCATFVGDKIYVLGGWNDAEKRTLDSILCYDIYCNKWTEAGQLDHAIRSAACLSYKQNIYLFGGSDKNNQVTNFVQIYCTTTGNVSPGNNPMPSANCLTNAVLWKSKALLVGCFSCYIFDFKTEKWEERERFQTGLLHFGLALDDNTLYTLGGGTCPADVWICSDEVKRLSVNNFINDNKLAEWKHHATLPAPAAVHACSAVSLYQSVVK